MAKILIVDDDPQLRKSFNKILSEDGHILQVAASGESGVAIVEKDPPDLVIMDVRMPGMSGLEAFQIMHKIEPKLPVIIMTAFGTTETAIEATKMGAFDYILKPFEILDIFELIEKALQAGRFMRDNVKLDPPPKVSNEEAIVGQSFPMQEIYKAIGRVAPTDATVLIRGESGTGKELVARALYQYSKRSNKSFLVINCVAIPETLLESELFGYEKGSFTGAVSRKIGKIEQADHGTVFLDEIGDMPFNIQAKILRLLQERSIERLGGRQPIPVNVRIIAATNRDLEDAVNKGRFREDLYYRLKVVSLYLPPLRERKEDVPLLAEYFLKQFCHEMGIPNPGISETGKRLLQENEWPGNVRELSNTIQKSLIFSRGGPLCYEGITLASHKGPDFFKNTGELEGEDINDILKRWIRKKITTSPSDKLFDKLIGHFESIITGEALNITKGNRTQAAKLLGLSRPTLLAKIDKHDLKIQTAVNMPNDV